MTTESVGPLPQAAGPRVLVVDDEKGFRSLLQWELSQRGVTVEAAEDAVEGERLADETDFEVVITDMTMPRGDGMSLLKAVKAKKPKTQVIIITGYGTVETAVQAMKIGAYDFLMKPFDLKNLLSRIESALGRPPAAGSAA